MLTLTAPPFIAAVRLSGVDYPVTGGTVTVPDEFRDELLAAGFNGGVPAAAAAPDATLGKVTMRRVVVGDDLDTPGWPYGSQINQALTCGTDGGGSAVSMYHDWTVPGGMASPWMTGLDNSASLGGTTTTKASVENSHFAWTKNGFTAPSVGILTGLSASAQHYGTVATIDKIRGLVSVPANVGVGQCAEMDGLEVKLIPGNSVNVYGVRVTQTTGGQSLVGIQVDDLTPANGGQAWAIRTGKGMVQHGDADETTFAAPAQGWLEPGAHLIRFHGPSGAACDAAGILAQTDSAAYFSAFSTLAVGTAARPALGCGLLGIGGQALSVHTTGDMAEVFGTSGYAVHDGTGTVTHMAAVMAWCNDIGAGAGAVAINAGFYGQRQTKGTLRASLYIEAHTYAYAGEHAVYVAGGRATFLEGLTFQTKAGAPTATQIPAGQFQVWKDSSSGALKLWANDGGTLKSVALT